MEAGNGIDRSTTMLLTAIRDGIELTREARHRADVLEADLSGLITSLLSVGTSAADQGR